MANPNAQAQTAPRNTPTAKPGTKDPAGAKEKKPKVKRVDHPSLFSVNEATKEKTRVKIKDWPSDYNAKTHKPLRRGDFENEATYLLKRAAEFEARAKQMRDEAAGVATLGSQADRAKAKRLSAMMKKIEELKVELSKQMGAEQVEAIVKAAMQSAGVDKEAKPEAAAAA